MVKATQLFERFTVSARLSVGLSQTLNIAEQLFLRFTLFSFLSIGAKLLTNKEKDRQEKKQRNQANKYADRRTGKERNSAICYKNNFLMY